MMVEVRIEDVFNFFVKKKIDREENLNMLFLKKK